VTGSLALKLTLTPILIAIATLAARRWGPTIGGWFAGLPLTSGPVSVFLALEQGRPFAASAARGSILGLVGVAAFCVTYAHAASRFGPVACLAFGFGGYAIATAATQFFPGNAWWSFALVCGVLAAALMMLPRDRDVSEPEAPAPWWDLPLRMVAATGMVLSITAAAATLGPTLSGVLSPFPVFSSVLAAFAHAMSGPAAAARLQRGVIIGVFSFATFFLVVSLLVTNESLVAAYAWASLAAIVVNSATLAVLRSSPKGLRDTA
jgi:hypothetical protein